jgi:hypothetical protein
MRHPLDRQIAAGALSRLREDRAEDPRQQSDDGDENDGFTQS